MSDAETAAEEAEALFERSSRSPVWWVVGGGVSLALAVVGMVTAFFGRVDQISLQLMTTLPLLMGIAALSVAWGQIRAPRRVAVGPEGVTIEDREHRRFAWEDIGWATVGTVPLSHRRQLVLYDTNGKTLVKISEAFNNFDRLIELVNQRVAAKEDDTAERIRGQKATRSAILCGSVGVLMLIGSGFMAWMTHQDQRAAEMLEAEGVKGEAEIVRRFLAPDGVTTRVEYRITTPNGDTATRNAEAFPAEWDKLEGAETVAVVYVPGHPAISKLAAGEPEDGSVTSRPVVAYGVCVLGGLISLFLIAAGVLQWNGWDIDLDSKTGKLSIKRFGTGR